MTAEPDDENVPGDRPPKRRRQEDRSHETQRRAIEAAISCLAKEGYAATTTIGVAKRAGLSRGGMLHHFPTKIDLIEAVVRDVELRLRAMRKSAVNKVEEPVERFVGLTQATWDSFQGEEILALTEIVLAMRGDEELEQRLAAVIGELDRFNLSGTFKVGHRAGIENERLLEAMHHLHYAAMRGLVIDALFLSDKDKLADSLALLLWYKKMLTATALSHPTDVPLPAEFDD